MEYKLDPKLGLNHIKEHTAKAVPAYWYGMCALKHEGFKEENEFRIVAILPDSNNQSQCRRRKEIKFREKDGEMTPYIELFGQDGVCLPIKRIIVGPHRNKESRVAMVKAMLQNDKRPSVKSIEVTSSEIPFKGMAF
jgi:hypothetical protein